MKLKKLAKVLALGTLMVLNTGVGHAAENEDLVNMAPTHRDVLVATVKNDDGQSRELRMNVFLPKNNGKETPALIYVHGGGWAMGNYEGDDAKNKPASKNVMAADNASTYKVFKSVLNDGIAFISVDYRLNNEAAFPAPLYDVKAAIRFVKAHAAEYNIDKNRIAIGGSSAGAHLSAEAALTAGDADCEGDIGGNLEENSRVVCCVDYYGPTDLLTMAPEMNPDFQAKEDAQRTHDAPEANESKLLGFSGEGEGVGVLREIVNNNDTSSPYWEKAQLALNASPINHVTKNAPPFFVAHGGHDSLVPIAQSIRLVNKLTDFGVENIFMVNSKAPHGYQGEVTNKAMRDWLKQKLFSQQ